MQKDRSSLCRVGERANKSHGIIIRQHAGKKEEFILKAKRKRKRLLSFLLALVLVVGMLPATAYASNEGEMEGTTGQMEDATVSGSDLTETTEELTVEEELLSVTDIEDTSITTELATTGSGTEADPYIVTDYDELRDLMVNA